jgi:hypothetical protein
VKAFQFRLEQARRWRSAQLVIQEGKVSAAGAAVARLQARIDNITLAIRSSAAVIREYPLGEVLGAHSDFCRQAGRQMRDFEQQHSEARRVLNVEMDHLIQARRRLRLIEGLRDAERTRWEKAFEKETADFADESYLGKLQAARNRATIKDTARARSSGG